jgi:hypothetical protein
LGTKTPIFPEEITTSFREYTHPYLKNSFISLISSAVEKRSLVPNEISQHYLTSRHKNNKFEVFMLNEEELRKLKADIEQRP